jgi:hypothetical protein
MSWQDHGHHLAWPTAGDTATLASDGERDAAARALNEAFAAGRLTADEHGDRVRAAYAARTRHELARLTADLPGSADAAAPAAGTPDGLDRCLLCALLIACPPAGIAWLLAARHRRRAGQLQARGAAGGLAGAGLASGAVAGTGSSWRAEDR